MKKITLVSALILSLVLSGKSQPFYKIYRSCSVVCLDDRWVPESYNLEAKTVINRSSKGVLSVRETGDFSDKSNTNRKDFVEFKIAIFKKGFDSLVSFSDETYTSISAKEVLDDCEAGDRIIIILKDSERYSLPHHTIEVI